ncbi:MAG TPA: hypothetical protein VGB17_09495 [Pyrinomonadaceae bacterium]|jgi:hypothetical protein
MVRPNWLFSKSSSIVFILTFTCLVFLGGGVWTSSHRLASHAYRQEIVPRVINKTNALQVLNVKRVGEGVSADVDVTLLNQSSKNVTAYMISMGEFSVTTCCSALPPGETRIEHIPFGNIEASAAKNPHRAGELVLSAVYLEGGDSEGEDPYLNNLKSRILGIKEQIRLVLPILHNALKSSQSNSENVLRRLESQASLLPTKDDHVALLPQRQGGRAWVKGKLQREIQYLKSRSNTVDGFDLRGQLIELIASYNQLLSRL